MAVTFPHLMQRLAPLGGPLAGRERELDQLRRAWADARDGACRLVLVAGEAGGGKTRLAAELAGEGEASGGDVVVGTCPAGGAEPYHPLVEALGPVPVGHRDRDAAFRELASGAAARARRTPMLLVLDDLHRTDRSTLLALRRILAADADGPCPMLVLATYRDTAVDRSHPLSEFLAAVVPLPGVERIALDGLDPDAIVDLVGDAEVARRVWRQSEGNPVRVRELVRLGALDRPLPPSFDELVSGRMAALTPSTRRFLEAAAVVGSEFSVHAAAAAAEVPADRVPAALKQLAGAGFVVEEPAGPGETRRFVHDMVREAIASGLEPVVRVRLHLRIGQALEQLDPRAAAPAALLAWHFRAAAPVGGSDAALRHSTAAGDLAMELMAWEEAAVHYGYALAAATGAAAGVRADLLLSLGEAQRLAGETARARQAFLEAAKLARICSDGDRLARAALALGQVAAAWGTDPELDELAGEARSLLGHDRPAAPIFSPETDFATEVLYDVLDGVIREPAAAVPASRPPVDPGAAALLRARHVALAGPEHTVDRLATADQMVALADEIGDDELAVTGWGWGVVDSVELGRLEQAAVHQAAHREVASRLGDPRHSADVAAWVAMRAMLEGRVDDAGAAAGNAYAFASEAGDPEAEESYLVQRWWVAIEWGTPEELVRIADECRARASASAGGRTWRAAAALTLARGGRLELAAEEVRRATDHGLGELIRDPGRLHPLSCLAEAAWMLGDGYRAATVGPLLEPFADRVIVAGRALACRGSVARACGLVAASACRWDEAEHYFEAALAAHRRMGALPLLARTRFEWSRLLAERGRKGDRRKAADFRRKSADLAGRLGMARLLEEIVRPAP